MEERKGKRGRRVLSEAEKGEGAKAWAGRIDNKPHMYNPAKVGGPEATAASKKDMCL